MASFTRTVKLASDTAFIPYADLHRFVEHLDDLGAKEDQPVHVVIFSATSPLESRTVSLTAEVPE